MNVTVISPLNMEFFVPLGLAPQLEANQVAFGLLSEGTACGVAQFDLVGDIATLVHIWVAPAYGRQGGGSRLVEVACGQMKGCGIGRLVSHPAYLPWDDQYYLRFFFAHCGFQDQGETAWVYTMTLAGLAKRLARQPVRADGNMVSLSQFPQSQWGGLIQTLGDEDFAKLVIRQDFDPNLTIVVIEQKKLAGYLALHRRDGQSLEVAGLRYQGSDNTVLGRLLSVATAKAAATLPGETQVTTMVNNPQVMTTLDRLLATVGHTKRPVHQFVL